MTNKTILNNIILDLDSNNASKILRAVKQLQKKYISGAEDKLVSILISKYRHKISWEVQSEIIKLIGKQHIVAGLPIIEEIVALNLEHDMVTIQAAAAFLRLTRGNLSDVNPIISKFGHMSYSVGEGFLSCLGEDSMIPDIKDQNLLISYFWNFGNPLPLGHIDPRYGLAQAASKWGTLESMDFLRHCTLSNDTKLCHFALKTLKKSGIHI